MPNVHEDRVRPLNDRPARDGKYVLYWMQQSQRTEENHALEYAVARAQERDESVVVGFGLTEDFPDSNLRHLTFMLEGLKEVSEKLKERDIKFALRLGNSAEVALEMSQDASLVVCDRGYRRLQRKWAEAVADRAECEVVQVESDLVVPVEKASDKREHAARTIRPKLTRQFEQYLEVPDAGKPLKSSVYLSVPGEDLSDPLALARRVDAPQDVPPVSHLFRGGTTEAKAVFRRFLDDSLGTYDDHRNQPHTDDVSHMSKYLHFGMVSPVWLLREVRARGEDDNVASFVEETLVRRELAANFCYYTPDYDDYGCLPEWARKTLEDHKDDEREYVYTRQQFEDAETHDPYWNAAMREMRYTGYMHNYMRMYWGKKILEWSNTPQYAFKTVQYLNNKYFLDGRDFNSYSNIAWVFGNHDRGWTENPVYGKVRLMKASGLKRKTKPDAYVEKVDELVAQATEAD